MLRPSTRSVPAHGEERPLLGRVEAPRRDLRHGADGGRSAARVERRVQRYPARLHVHAVVRLAPGALDDDGHVAGAEHRAASFAARVPDVRRERGSQPRAADEHSPRQAVVGVEKGVRGISEPGDRDGDVHVVRGDGHVQPLLVPEHTRRAAETERRPVDARQAPEEGPCPRAARRGIDDGVGRRGQLAHGRD